MPTLKKLPPGDADVAAFGQFVVALVGLAMVRPLGKASLMPSNNSEVVLALFNVSVKVLVPSAATVAGEKAIVTVGGMGTTTVKSVLTAAALLPLEV